jgi:hypothetical protein
MAKTNKKTPPMEKKEVKKTLKIIGFKNIPRWKNKFTCTCNDTQDYKNCKYCNYTNNENSVPREPFSVKDDKGKDILITEIEIRRGSDDEITGWVYSG